MADQDKADTNTTPQRDNKKRSRDDEEPAEPAAAAAATTTTTSSSSNGDGVNKRVATEENAVKSSSEPVTETENATEDTTVKTISHDVPDSQVARVLGSNPEASIQSMENVSGAKVEVPPTGDSVTHMRTIKITGTDAQIKAFQTILKQKIDNVGIMGAPPVPAPGVGFAPGAGLPAPLVKVLHVPDDQVGRVIGKMGQTIRQIQELSGAHMDIAKECKPGDSFREITVTGTPQQVTYCESLINAKLAGDPLPTAPSQLAAGQVELKVYVPNDMVGRIIGKNGITIREIQEQSGAHMDIAKECAPGKTDREVTLKGTPQQIEVCNEMLQSKVSGTAKTDSGAPYDPMASQYSQYVSIYQQAQAAKSMYAPPSAQTIKQQQKQNLAAQAAAWAAAKAAGKPPPKIETHAVPQVYYPPAQQAYGAPYGAQGYGQYGQPDPYQQQQQYQQPPQHQQQYQQQYQPPQQQQSGYSQPPPGYQQY